MLSTSNKTKFQYQYLLVAVVILAMVSVIALYQSGIMPVISTGQQASTVENLSWPPRPDFSHLNQQAIIPVTGSAEGLATYYNVESARWMGAALASQATEQQIRNVESARWMGAALASQAQATEQQIRDVESARWMGAALASQSQEMSFHYTWPGR